ncbi:MAG: DUF721 domain-containing protein [Deltaproteobacteria bacterium]|nr:DUF721 domain-containing protein [Deltaproteobacteria bacterium]
MAGKDPLKGISPFKISSVISKSYAHLGIEAKLREHHIKKTWAEAVGNLIAAKSSPSRLIGTTLYCVVSSAPWMSELSYQKPVIIARLNELLGKGVTPCVGAVTEIVFKPGKVASRAPKAAKAAHRKLTHEEKEAIEETVKPVKDETLKALIKRAMEKAKG